MSVIEDGPVWCEGCGEWLPSRAEFAGRHWDRCPESRATLVERHGVGGRSPLETLRLSVRISEAVLRAKTEATRAAR